MAISKGFEAHIDFLLRRVDPLVLLGLLAVFVAICLYRQAFSTDIPKISGIPEPSGAVPFYGHLKVLGDDHPTKFEQWGNENNWPIIQAKFGSRRVVVLNSFEAAREWTVKNAASTIDRPLFYTFHSVLSTTQGQ